MTPDAMKRCSTLGLFVLTFSGVAFGIVGRHDRNDAAFVELGRRFNSVGKVLPEGGCTLIAPTWVITAAHVAASLRPEESSVRFDDMEYPVKRIVMHPQGNPRSDAPPEVDVALLELGAEVRGCRPVPLYRGRDEQGRTVFVVGYGDVGDGKGAPRRSNGRRRAATNTIDDAGPARIFLKFDAPPEGTDLEGVGGPGDSGGPALIEHEGLHYLVGVSSGSMKGRPGQYAVVDVYMRVSSFVDWIEQNITPDAKE